MKCYVPSTDGVDAVDVVVVVVALFVDDDALCLADVTMNWKPSGNFPHDIVRSKAFVGMGVSFIIRVRSMSSMSWISAADGASGKMLLKASCSMRRCLCSWAASLINT